MGLLERLRGPLDNKSEANSSRVEKDLKTRQEEVKYQLLRSIDERIIPYEANLSVLQNREQCSKEKDIVKQQINVYNKELQKVFTNGEIFLIKQQLYQKADLRCEFKEKNGNLSENKLKKLLELEHQTSSDGGREFIKICQRLGLIELRRPLKTHENITRSRHQGRSAGTSGKEMVKENANVQIR